MHSLIFYRWINQGRLKYYRRLHPHQIPFLNIRLSAIQLPQHSLYLHIDFEDGPSRPQLENANGDAFKEFLVAPFKHPFEMQVFR